MQQPEGIHLTIANTIVDLVQGDIKEHLPVERIPLKGNVLGMGTTTSIDNGELAFAYDTVAEETSIYKCHANTGGIDKVCAGDGSDHFPYACFSSDVREQGYLIDLSKLDGEAGWLLSDWIKAGIATIDHPALIYGVRVRCQWEHLVITVASKLCMGQRNRNSAAESEAGSGAAIYDALQHYFLSADIPSDLDSKIHYLGDALEWDCCGFYDTEPETGRVTVAQAGANLHMHGISADHRFGGHLHYEHGDSRLGEIDELVIYPIATISHLGSDLSVNSLTWHAGVLSFEVANLGGLDVSDIGIDVVPDDCYSLRQYLRLPWLAAGGRESFSLPLSLSPGSHRILVAVDPVGDIIEPESDRANNRVWLDCSVI